MSEFATLAVIFILKGRLCTWRCWPNFSGFLPQVYSADGEFLFKFGSHGEGNGQFNAPTGVAVDANGNIIVADWGNSRIQVRQLAVYV